MAKKKRKSAEEKEELEWYDIDKHYDPNDPDVISCQEAAEEWDEALREKSSFCTNLTISCENFTRFFDRSFPVCL